MLNTNILLHETVITIKALGWQRGLNEEDVPMEKFSSLAGCERRTKKGIVSPKQF